MTATNLKLPPSAQTVLSAIARAAGERRRCPSNRELAEAMGAYADNSASEALLLLERRGYVMVDRSQAVRVVTILATGEATAPGSAVGGGSRYVRPFQRMERTAVPPQGRPAKTIERESARGAPCARCGARIDTVCGHTASRLIGSLPAWTIFA